MSSSSLSRKRNSQTHSVKRIHMRRTLIENYLLRNIYKKLNFKRISKFLVIIFIEIFLQILTLHYENQQDLLCICRGYDSSLFS